MPLKPGQFKVAVYGQIARIGKSLASGPRLEILDLLSQAPRTVEAIARHLGQSVANTSHHLQVLRAARLVEAERDGVFITYRIASDEVADLCRAVRRLAESRLAEIEQVSRRFFSEREAMEPVDRRALIERVRDGTVALLDVRPPEEYRAGHIPGAISIPLDELERRLAELPRDREVVAYCRGPYCVLAAEAVALLRRSGFTAQRLGEGVADWRARGFAIEASPPGDGAAPRVARPEER